MQAICPKCSQAVPSEDINIQAMTALCRRCNEIFPVPVAAVEAPILGIPAPFQVVEDTSRSLHVSWRWWRWQYLFLVFFCIAWDGFLFFWYSMALFSHATAGGLEWLSILFPICHVAVGVGMTYFVIATLFNWTRIRAEGDDLEILHGPVPWRGDRRLPLSTLTAIRVDSYNPYNPYNPYKSGYFAFGKGMSQIDQFALTAVIGGKQVSLLKGLDEQQALWLKQKLSQLR